MLVVCQAVSELVLIMATGALARPNYQGGSLDGVGRGLLFIFGPETAGPEVLEAAWASTPPSTTYIFHYETLI